YEHWLDGIARVLVEKGVVSDQELAARTAFFAERPEAPVSAAVRAMPATPAPRLHWFAPESERPATRPPRFAVGDTVRTRNIHPTGHTRLPRYARGKHGVIHRQHGTHVFPDSNAHGGGEQPEALYSVRFDARELWGPAAEPNQHVYIDLWEPYLEPGDPRGEEPPERRQVRGLTRARAGIDPPREGDPAARRGGPRDPALRGRHRSDGRRARGGARLGGPGLQAAPPRGAARRAPGLRPRLRHAARRREH